MGSTIPRRRLLKSAGALASAGVLLKPDGKSIALPADDNRPRALALIGDRYHNADYIRVALNRLFGELNLPIDYTINYDQISARLLASYRLSVVLRDGMIWPHGCLEPNDYEYSHALENSGGGCAVRLAQQQSHFAFFQGLPRGDGSGVYRSSAPASLLGVGGEQGAPDYARGARLHC